MKSFLNRFRRNEEDEQPPVAPGTPAAEKRTADSAEKARRGKGEQPVPKPGSGTAGKQDALVLELGDFLHRIPPQLLRPGTPDVHTELRFDLADIAERISRGETTIPIQELYAQVPHIFTNELPESGNLEIRFPWQKVLKLINESAPGTVPTSSLTVAAEESLAYKLKTRHVTRNIATGRGAGGLNVPESPLGKPGSKLAQRPVTWFSRPTPAPPIAAGTDAPAPAEGNETEAPTPPESAPAETGEANASPTSAPLGVQDSTALIEAIRAELEMEFEAELRARDEELAAIREEYQKQIDDLQAELAALKQERGDSSAEALDRAAE